MKPIRDKKPKLLFARAFAVHPRLRLDASVADILYGLGACAWARNERRLAGEVLRACSLEGNGLVCLSVRSGFDLLLGTLGLPEGSEILISAVNHPDMARIARAHGLVPIPIDIDNETLSPRPELLDGALTPRTKLILVAHLFGGRADLDPVAGFADRHGLLLIEDCAQEFRGPGEMGHPRAHVSMYSFGPIKTATAFGGAILRVQNPRLLGRMQANHAAYPVRSRRGYAAKLWKFLLLSLISHPTAYGLFVRLCSLLGPDLDDLVGGAARSFSAQDAPTLLKLLRHRPSPPLLALLVRRLRGFDAKRLGRRALRGHVATQLLAPLVTVPGRGSRARTHWLFPITTPNPAPLIHALRRQGFDASRATSNIAVVEPPKDRPRLAPDLAQAMMENLVFLPIYPELPDKALQRLARIVADHAST